MHRTSTRADWASTSIPSISIFSFNYISPLHSPEELSEFYFFYHRKTWIFQKLWKGKKRNLLLLNLSSALLVSLRTILGGITLNPAVLGSLSAAGILLKVFAEAKDFKGSSEKAKLTWESYSRMLAEIRTLLRGAEYSSSEMIQRLKALDEQIIQLGLSADSFLEEYERTFE